MKNLAILFVIYFGVAASVHICCTGSLDTLTYKFTGLVPTTCQSGTTDRCVIDVQQFGRNYSCGSESTPGSYYCYTDYCNCPSYDSGNVFGEMKKIMYPVMGMIFGVLWIIQAFIGARLPVSIILIVVGLIDAILGIFLILLPITTFLGLFYMAVGTFTIAVSRHSWGGDTGVNFLLALTVIVFLLTGGLTFVAFDFGSGNDYVTRIRSYLPYCVRDMNLLHIEGNNIINDGKIRCENYTYFVTFCVYLLFLIQPIAMVAAAYKRVGNHKFTLVLLTDKHELD
jgi:hypothetical protein